MGNALGKVRELGLEGVSVDKERYVSFALAGGKQHVIKTNDMRYDILLYRKGHEPVALDLGSELPITDEVYKYLGINPLEAAIVRIVKAYQSRDEYALNALLLPDFGCAVVHEPGIYCVVSVYPKVSFSEGQPDALYLMNGVTCITEFNVHFEKHQANRYGIYCDTTSTDGTLAGIAKSMNYAEISEWSARELENFEAIDNSSHSVWVVDKNWAFYFTVTFRHGQWWLSAILRGCGGE
jgi:hypothetical protein